MTTEQRLRWIIKPGIFVTCLLPLASLVWDGFMGSLGANPVEEITHRSGDWILRLLLITLAITPLRRITGLSRLVRLRRMLGLFAFFYACLHFTTYLWLDRELLFGTIAEDILERPYITIGFTAFILLIPLAMTSTAGMIRRLGRNWRRIHRLAYVIPVLGVIHFLWLVKADIREPLLYAAVLAILLGYRVWYQRHRLHVRSATVNSVAVE